MRIPATCVALAASLSVSTAIAQLPQWVSLPSANPSSFFAESTIVVVDDDDGYHAYSSYTRKWADLVTTSLTPTFYGYDDHCVILDGSTAWAFATRRGVWEPIAIGPTAVMSSATTGAVWISAVLDGNDVHTFSSMTGEWTTSTFAASPGVAVSRMVAVMTDGNRTVGFSAHYGAPVELSVSGAVQLDATGYCGVVRDGTNAYVFSAYRNTWRTLPMPSTASLIKPPNRAGYIAIRDANTINFYSALTDNQVLLVADQNATLTTQANVAAVQVGNAVVGYSCASGTVDVVAATAGITNVNVQQELLTVEDGNGDLYGFGVLAGSFSPAQTGGFSVFANTGAVLAQSYVDGTWRAFSCMTNTWEPEPSGSSTGVFYVNYNGAVLVEANGTMHGFSTNRGTWTTQVAPVGDVYAQHKAAFCARSGNRLDAFNGRTGRWATVFTAQPAMPACFDMSVIADDGANLYCYSVYDESWSTTPCVTVQKQLRDECAYAYDGSVVHAWSGSCQVSEWANMPEYWRILARGGRANFDVAGEPGELVCVAMSTAVAATPLPTQWGFVFIDPTSLYLVPVLVPAFGTASIGLQVPDSPALRGLVLCAQGFVYSPTLGDFYLTGYFESTIM
ncbi:MAG: hypothetical protein H6835_02320 [Planctomycetes bacterium]|nr:hypothetical protein [Planctomycetota bacterium]